MTEQARSLEPIASPSRTPRAPASISYRQLSLLLLAFIAGAVVVLLVENHVEGGGITFSTVSLIGFLFGIVLSGASTVLAIAAISLGKASEQAMIERSDQSIRLQNEVFVKTTDALSRIESSTGVTEKRIEDIVAGRAGTLSHRLAEALGSAEFERAKDPKALEKRIRESLLAELGSPADGDPKAQADAAARRATEMKAYREFQTAVLLRLANSKELVAEKIGDGRFDSAGDNLVDGVFTVGDQRVGVCAFGLRNSLGLRPSFGSLMMKLIGELGNNTFTRVVLAFDGKLVEKDPYRRAMEKALAVAKSELGARIQVLDGDKNTVLNQIELAVLGRPLA